MEFTRATRKQVKARIAIAGPAGAGKTYTALIAASTLANGGRIALIDTERQSARLYADEFEFDVLELDTFAPAMYEKAIKAAEQGGYGVLVIDSLSHAWEGAGGALDQKGKLEDQRGYNSWTAWRKITPMHDSLVDTMLRANMHVIATLRSKMEYEQVTENGKSMVQKIGLAPVQRSGMEYEFTLFCDMDVNHSIMVSKTRSKPMTDAAAHLPDASFWQPFAMWLDSGEAYVEYTAPTEHEGEYVVGDQEERVAIKNGRPWDAATLRANLLKRTGQLRTKGDEYQVPAAKGVVGKMTGELNGILGDDDRRHTFLQAVFGKPSTKDMDKAQVQTVLDWMDGKAGMEVITDEANRLVNGVITEQDADA